AGRGNRGCELRVLVSGRALPRFLRESKAQANRRGRRLCRDDLRGRRRSPRRNLEPGRNDRFLGWTKYGAFAREGFRRNAGAPDETRRGAGRHESPLAVFSSGRPSLRLLRDAEHHAKGRSLLRLGRRQGEQASPRKRMERRVCEGPPSVRAWNTAL